MDIFRLYYMHPTLHPSFDTSDLPTVPTRGWTVKLYVGYTLNWKKVSLSDLLQIGRWHTSVGIGSQNFCKSDALVFVGQMNNLSP